MTIPASYVWITYDTYTATQRQSIICTLTNKKNLTFYRLWKPQWILQRKQTPSPKKQTIEIPIFIPIRFKCAKVRLQIRLLFVYSSMFSPADSRHSQADQPSHSSEFRLSQLSTVLKPSVISSQLQSKYRLHLIPDNSVYWQTLMMVTQEHCTRSKYLP